MQTHIYVCIYKCVCTYKIYTVHMYIYIYLYMSIYIYICIYVIIYIYICMCTYMYTCIYICTYVFIYIYTCMCTYMYIHTVYAYVMPHYIAHLPYRRRSFKYKYKIHLNKSQECVSNDHKQKNPCNFSCTLTFLCKI